MNRNEIRHALHKAAARAVVEALNAGRPFEEVHAAGLAAVEIESVLLTQKIRKEARGEASAFGPASRSPGGDETRQRAPEGPQHRF